MTQIHSTGLITQVNLVPGGALFRFIDGASYRPSCGAKVQAAFGGHFIKAPMTQSPPKPAAA